MAWLIMNRVSVSPRPGGCFALPGSGAGGLPRVVGADPGIGVRASPEPKPTGLSMTR